MKKFITALIATASFIVATSAIADTAKSEKHAKKATQNRQAVFSLLGSNMSPLGAMAKGKKIFDIEAIQKHALRINQLSLMIADYTHTDTSSFKVETEALNDVWEKPEAFEKRINALITASANLQKVAKLGNESAIKKAIGGVGKSCGGCHKNFKED